MAKKAMKRKSVTTTEPAATTHAVDVGFCLLLPGAIKSERLYAEVRKALATLPWSSTELQVGKPWKE